MIEQKLELIESAFSAEGLDTIKKVIAKKNGAVLFYGEIGSGKVSLAASCLQMLVSESNPTTNGILMFEELRDEKSALDFFEKSESRICISTLTCSSELGAIQMLKNNLEIKSENLRFLHAIVEVNFEKEGLKANVHLPILT